MEATIYIDVEPWMNTPEQLWPKVAPSDRKSPTAIRYKIVFDIPDPQEPDVVINTEAVVVEDAERP